MTENTPTALPADLKLAHVNPAELQVIDQAREDATPDEALIASVRAHGIIQPPVVRLNATGDGYTIVAGHRRVGAAITAGLDEITVIVRADESVTEALTLEQQIVENERRKGLSANDLAAGYQKLTLFGLRPEDIAAGLGEKTERVRAGLQITKSKTATELVEQEPTIDFEQAATIADFDTHPKLQKKLIETATTRPENFARDVEQARRDRQFEIALAELKAQLADEGTTFIESFSYPLPDWTKKGGMYGGPGAAVGKLADAEGNQLTAAAHAGCPGHAAIIHRASSFYLDREDGMEVVHVCTDWETNGHQKWQRPDSEKSPEQIEREAEWERRRIEVEKANAERAKRRELVDANTRARRTWLHGYLNTGRLRPIASHFDVLALSAGSQLRLQEAPAVHVALELLTGTPHERDRWDSDDNLNDLLALIEDDRTPSFRIVLALAVAYLDDAPETAEGVAYFDALVSWGYTLTDTDREHVAAASEAVVERQADADAED